MGRGRQSLGAALVARRAMAGLRLGRDRRAGGIRPPGVRLAGGDAGLERRGRLPLLAGRRTRALLPVAGRRNYGGGGDAGDQGGPVAAECRAGGAAVQPDRAGIRGHARRATLRGVRSRGSAALYAGHQLAGKIAVSHLTARPRSALGETTAARSRSPAPGRETREYRIGFLTEPWPRPAA